MSLSPFIEFYDGAEVRREYTTLHGCVALLPGETLTDALAGIGLTPYSIPYGVLWLESTWDAEREVWRCPFVSTRPFLLPCGIESRATQMGAPLCHVRLQEDE